MHQFPILIEECEEGGYFGECPALQGCHVQGETYEETIIELKAAVEAMVDDIIDSGEKLPSKFHSLSVLTIEN